MCRPLLLNWDARVPFEYYSLKVCARLLRFNLVQFSRVTGAPWVCRGKCREPQEHRSWRCQPDSRPPVAVHLYWGSWGRTLRRGGEPGQDTAASPPQSLDPCPCRFSQPSVKQQHKAEGYDGNILLRSHLKKTNWTLDGSAVRNQACISAVVRWLPTVLCLVLEKTLSVEWKIEEKYWLSIRPAITNWSK